MLHYIYQVTELAEANAEEDECFMAAREVGGDFYDFLYFDDGQLGLVIGDVTDKGVPAALVMATVRSMIRSAAVGEVKYQADVPVLIQVQASKNDLVVRINPSTSNLTSATIYQGRFSSIFADVANPLTIIRI